MAGDNEISQGLVARIEAHAARHGDWPALLGQSGTLSYAGLNSAANRVAHALLVTRRSESVAPDPGGRPGGHLVAICMAPSVARIVAILGVLKARASYCLINPALSDGGIAELLAHAGPGLTLCDRANLDRVVALGQRAVDVAALDAGGQHGNPGVPTRDADMAYLRYTSGSTGRPKGVVHSHRAALGEALIYAGSMQLRPLDRLCHLAFYPPATVMGALVAGASLLVLDPRQAGLRVMTEGIRAARVTVLHVFASGLRTLGPALLAGGALPDLRAVCFSAEPVSAADVTLAQRLMPAGGMVVNKLGSSEFSQIASHVITAPPEPDQPVPIGAPPPGVRISLAGADGEEVPPGAEGEIVVHSRFVSDGYWKNPELTNAVYGVDADGVPFYRTGDIGRVDAMGLISIVGRVDNQIKLRAFRISPEEIEDVMHRHPGVTRAVVRSFVDERGEALLAAFIVPASGHTVDRRAMRDFARARLPEAIVPTVFLPCDALPMTAGGKLDRKALPDPLPLWRAATTG